MKSILLALSLFIFHFSFSQNISDLDTFEKSIKPRAILTYDVTMGEKKYQFVATLKKVGDEVAFDWKALDPENKEGSIVVSTDACLTANAVFSDFTNGNFRLDKETALFISKKIFNDIAANAQANIKLGGLEDTAVVMSNTISEFNFNLNGGLVAVPGWDLQGGTEIKYTIDVIESTKFPLITRMDMGWTMQLVEIRNP